MFIIFVPSVIFLVITIKYLIGLNLCVRLHCTILQTCKNCIRVQYEPLECLYIFQGSFLIAKTIYEMHSFVEFYACSTFL
jgi:hypothetical protein